MNACAEYVQVLALITKCVLSELNITSFSSMFKNKLSNAI